MTNVVSKILIIGAIGAFFVSKVKSCPYKVNLKEGPMPVDSSHFAIECERNFYIYFVEMNSMTKRNPCHWVSKEK